MPVPATYRAEWRIDHAPAKHLASAKLKKLLSEKEIRRDDNYNIQEVTETEVPRNRYYSGLNGNGVHTEECPQRPQTAITNYTDSVKIIKTPARQEYRYGVHYDIDDSRVYREAVRLIPGVPNNGRHYSTMTRCFIGSKIRRYTESVYITLGAPQPKQFSTSVFVFPKACRETFVSSVEHHDEETMKLYKVGVKMEAKDYVSVKFVQID